MVVVVLCILLLREDDVRLHEGCQFQIVRFLMLMVTEMFLILDRQNYEQLQEVSQGKRWNQKCCTHVW